MELVKRKMPDNYNLYQVSDTHLGPVCCFKKGIRNVIKKIEQDPIGYMVFTGDAVDAIVPGDKRYAVYVTEHKLPTPQAQWKQVVKMFEPVKEKILGWMIGNHEYTIINTVNIGKEIAESLNVPYGGYMCKFTAVDKKGKVMHKFLFWHGNGSLRSAAKDPIQKKANRLANLKLKMVNTGHTDCIYMGCGHYHPDQFLIQPPTIDDEVTLTDRGGKIVQKQRNITKQNVDYIPPESRFYGVSPGFLMAYSEPNSGVISYSEKAGFSPTRLGWLELKIRDRQLVEVQGIDAL